MKAEQCGIVAVDGQRRYIMDMRVIQKGKKAGQVEVRLVNGVKKIVLPQQIAKGVPDADL